MSSSGVVVVPSKFSLVSIDPHRNGIDDVRVHQQSVQQATVFALISSSGR
jgi:hypothetical protein